MYRVKRQRVSIAAAAAPHERPGTAASSVDQNRAKIFEILSTVRNRVAPPDVAVDDVEVDHGHDNDNIDDDSENKSANATAAAGGGGGGGGFTFGDALDESIHNNNDDAVVDHHHLAAAPTLPPSTGQQQQQQQQQHHRRRSSNCYLPSTARVQAALSRKSTTLQDKLHALAEQEKLVNKAQKRMHEVLSEEMKSFCDKTDNVMAVALAGVPTGREYQDRREEEKDSDPLDAENWTKHRQQREGLLYSSLVEGTRPFEVLSGTALLPSYSVLHPSAEWKETDADSLPRELMNFFVKES